MEWTEAEQEVLTEQDVRDAVNKLLAEWKTQDGRINIADMSRTEIDFTIHLLRKYRATKFGFSATELRGAA